MPAWRQLAPEAVPAADHHGTKDQFSIARRLYDQQDMTVAQIGEVLGVSRSTIYRALRRDPDFTPSQRRRANP